MRWYWTISVCRQPNNYARTYIHTFCGASLVFVPTTKQLLQNVCMYLFILFLKTSNKSGLPNETSGLRVAVALWKLGNVSKNLSCEARFVRAATVLVATQFTPLMWDRMYTRIECRRPLLKGIALAR